VHFMAQLPKEVQQWGFAKDLVRGVLDTLLDV
jgi:hypothetical protein